MKSGSQRVIVQFPKELLSRADEVAKKLDVSRSELIRTALEEKIQAVERERLNAELREGYTALAGERSRSHQEFHGFN